MANMKGNDKFEKRMADYLPEITEMARKGVTKRDICEIFSISPSTYYDWEKKHPELREAYDFGLDLQLDDIENAAYKAARGHVVKEEWTDERGNVIKTFNKELAPNQRSIEYILNNRRPEKWRSDTKLIDISLSEKMKDKLGELSAADLIALANAGDEEITTEEKGE